jgi:class 3 adenylate cyclase
VAAALTIRHRLQTFECDATPERRLHFKIGISSGEVVVGNAGMPNLMNYTAIGDTVNVAKRLQEEAETDQILISAHTYEAVQGEVSARALGPRHVKGRTAAVHVYDLLGSDVLERAWDEE